MNNISSNVISINQLLHGYRDGHRLIAGSVKPDRKSDSKLISLSDLSGYGINPGIPGYVTGYPLPEMQTYAIACTWLAPEMSRPGCVWTHTLLLEFSDLSLIQNSHSILKLFNRPDNVNDLSEYKTPISYKISEPCAQYFSLKYNYLVSILLALYEQPSKKVFVESDNTIQANHLAISIWLQQWPRLKRTFRFCTMCSSDRSKQDDIFDLQFIPNKLNHKERFKKQTNGVWVGRESQKDHNLSRLLNEIAKDIEEAGNDSTLRRFLWRYGAETNAGRKAFLPIANIWLTLNSKFDANFDFAIKIAKTFKPRLDSLTIKLLHHVISFYSRENDVTEYMVDFILSNLDLLENNDEINASEIANIILDSFPDKIWPLFNEGSHIEKEIAIAGIIKMPDDIVLPRILNNEELFGIVLKANPKIAESPKIWNSHYPIPNIAAKILSEKGSSSTVFQAMIDSDNQSIPIIAIKYFGQAAIDFAVNLLNRTSEYKKENIHNWLLAAKERPDYLQIAILNIKNISTDSLSILSMFINYKSAPITKNSDEWVTSIKSNYKKGNNKPFNLCAFLLARALSGISSDPSFLINFSFDTIHRGLLKSREDFHSWDIIQKELPPASFLEIWDRAGRVRKAVVHFYINKCLPIDDFLFITKDADLFSKLVKIAITKENGIKYLEDAISTSLKKNNYKNKEFIKILKKAIDRNKKRNS